MAGSSKGTKDVLLRTADGGAFMVARSMAAEMVSIRREIEAGDGEKEEGIVVPNVTRRVLREIVRFLHTHVEMASSFGPTTLERFDKQFLNVSLDFLYHILLGAYHLKIVSLRDLACQKVADMMKGKSIDEIRTTFNLPNEYSANEMVQIMNMFPWIFDRQFDDEERESVEKDNYIDNRGGGISMENVKHAKDEGGSIEKDSHVENKEGTNMEENLVENEEGDKQTEDKAEGKSVEKDEDIENEVVGVSREKGKPIENKEKGESVEERERNEQGKKSKIGCGTKAFE